MTELLQEFYFIMAYSVLFYAILSDNMFNKKKCRLWFKAIALGIVCLFTLNSISWSLPESTLAAQSRLKPFFKKHGLGFQNIATVVYVAGRLKNLVTAGTLRESHIVKLNRLFPNADVEIEKNVKTGTLKCTGRTYNYAVFHFKKEKKTINALFIKDHDKLTNDELREWRIKKEEAHHLDCTGLKGVWFVNSGKPYALIDTNAFKDAAHRKLQCDLALFKIGHQYIINHYADGMTHLIRNRLGEINPKEWILLHWRVKDAPLPHAAIFLMDIISKNLGIETRYIDIDSSLFFAYQRMSMKERKKAVAEKSFVFNTMYTNARGKKAIILEGTFCTGAAIDRMRDIAINSGISQIESFVIFDASGNLSFEREIYRILMYDRREQVIAILNGENKLTTSIIKYTIQLASESQETFKDFIDRVTPNRVKDLIRYVKIYKTFLPQEHSIDCELFLRIAADSLAKRVRPSTTTQVTQEEISSAIDDINRVSGKVIFDESDKNKIVQKVLNMGLIKGKNILVVGVGEEDYLPILLARLGLKVAVIDTDLSEATGFELLRYMYVDQFNLASHDALTFSKYDSLAWYAKKYNIKFDYITLLGVVHYITDFFRNVGMDSSLASIITGIFTSGMEMPDSIRNNLQEYSEDTYVEKMTDMLRPIVSNLNLDGGFLFVNSPGSMDWKNVGEGSRFPPTTKALYYLQKALSNLEKEVEANFALQPQIDIDNFSVDSHHLNEGRRSAVYKAEKNDRKKNTSEQLTAQNETERIHAENLKLEYMPTIPDKTILCHIVAASILPDGQKGMLKKLEQDMRKRDDYAEKVVSLSVNDPNSQEEFLRELGKIIAKEERRYQKKGYTVQFDVACPSKELVDRVQDRLDIQALAFAREGEGDIIQVEGIILALRVLRTGKIEDLLNVYKLLTGKEFETNINNIKELAKNILFVLPVTRLDVDEIDTINTLIEKNIKSAA